MHTHTLAPPLAPVLPVWASSRRAPLVRVRQVWRPLSGAVLLATAAAAAQAVDMGPLTLNGFVKAEYTHGSNQCPNCAVNPGEAKDKVWADPLIPGSRLQTRGDLVTLVQPFLGLKFDLPRGFKVGGLLSQRWRDGKEDIPGFLWDRHVWASHEDYGRLAIGAMVSRSWSLSDYPFGTDIGVAAPWASSGAGYGLLGHALRYTSRPLDVTVGDLVLEATYDQGASGWKKNKPQFIELYAQFYREGLQVDMIYQDSRNGTPSAWGQGPFTGLTPFPRDDAKLGGSGQSIALVMGRWRVNPSWELLGGLRHNRWSGAYARMTVPPAEDWSALAQWNNPFNVDWFCKEATPARCDIDSPGYAARSLDGTVGVRYRMGPWTAHTGMLFLGQAKTKNPSERGQSNHALINTAGLEYDFRNGLKVHGFAGMVRYRQLGLSPMSMPANNAFTQVDSRAATRGNWVGFGATYVF